MNYLEQRKRSHKMRLLCVGLLVGCGIANANDIYLSQNGGGAADGTSCSSANAVGFFNASNNWTKGAPASSQIGPGTTVHLCGTFTAPAGSSNYLQFQGSGAAGSPITLLFENNAILQAPYWAGSGYGGAISVSGANFITIDGGTNGTIQATANGTLLANHADFGSGIYGTGASNVTIQNLTISNIYVHSCVLPVSGCTDEGGQDTSGILMLEGSNLNFNHLTLHDAKWCLNYRFGAPSNNIVVNNNNIYNCDHGVAIGDEGSNDTMSGLVVFGNNIHDGGNWDDAAVGNHHDGIHVWVNNGPSSSTSKALIYNNYVYGNWGVGINAWIFTEGGTSHTGDVVFNNILIDGGTVPHLGCGYICLGGTSANVYNNTIVGQSKVTGLGLNVQTGTNVENNILSTMQEATQLSGGAPNTFDYNLYYNIGGNGWNLSDTISQWRSQCNCDSHSVTNNPNLNGTYHLQTTGAPALYGANLTSLGIPALDVDAANVSRPSGNCAKQGSSGCWDMGAFQYVPPPVAAPTNLKAVVQ